MLVTETKEEQYLIETVGIIDLILNYELPPEIEIGRALLDIDILLHWTLEELAVKNYNHQFDVVAEVQYQIFQVNDLDDKNRTLLNNCRKELFDLYKQLQFNHSVMQEFPDHLDAEF